MGGLVGHLGTPVRLSTVRNHKGATNFSTDIHTYLRNLDIPSLIAKPSGKLKSTMTLCSKESFLGTEFKGEIAISSIKGLA
jgi:hypothetical protein